MQPIKSVISVIVGLALVIGAQVAAAQGNSQGKGNGNGNGNGNAKGFGQSMNIGVGNASDGIMARIITDRDIFYTGDPLAISVVFPRGAERITSGAADAYVVVFAPAPEADDSDDDSTDDSSDDSSDDSTGDDASDDSSGDDGTAGTDTVLTDAIVLPVSSDASADETVLFSIDAVDVSALPAGTYQLGLILTNPGGDPLVINDWYGGLLGLEHVRGLTVASEAVEFDADGDGEVDDDSDDDGFSDDEDEEDEEDEG